MSIAFFNHLLQSYGYIAIFAFIALESVGIPLPGETTLITAAIYAGSTHRLNIGLIVLVASVAAVAGDNGGYWLGKQGGTKVVQRYGRRVGLTARRMKAGRYLFARHGGKVVFFGRFITVLRTYAAFFAGLNAMRWPRFLAANAAGGVLWAVVVGFGAYALGNAASGLGSMLTYIGLGLTVALAVVLSLVMKRQMRRWEDRAEAAYPDPAPAPAREPALH